MHWGWSFMCQLWLLFMFSFLSLPFSAEAVLEVSLFSFSRFCPVVSSKAVCGRRLGSVSFLCLLSSLLCFHSSGSVSGRRCGNVSFLSPHPSVLCFSNSCLHWKTWQSVAFLSLLFFFFFSSAGFISANGIYKWKGTTFFAIFEVTSCLHWKALQTVSFLSSLLDFHQKLSAFEGFADHLISFCSPGFSPKAVCIGRLCKLSHFFLLSCIFIKSCLHWKAQQKGLVSFSFFLSCVFIKIWLWWKSWQTVSFLHSVLRFRQKLCMMKCLVEQKGIISCLSFTFFPCFQK